MGQKKGYVVLQSGWEYNDEVYMSTDGGTPLKVFADRGDAERYAQKMTLEELRKLPRDGLASYGYDWGEVFESSDEEKTSKLLAEAFGRKRFNLEDWWADGASIPEKISDENLQKVESAIILQFYEVVEVDVDGNLSK